MSEASYQHNLKLGVTGPRTDTCYLAAFDRISETTGIIPQTYERYNNLRQKFVDEVGDDNNYMPQDIKQESRDIFKVSHRDLGVHIENTIRYTRATSPDELRKALAKLTMGGFRSVVYLDTGGLHAVGVQQLDEDTYLTKSTWSPFENDIASIASIFALLDQAPRQRTRQNSSRKTTKPANIVALPPEGPDTRPPFPHV